MHLLSAIHIQDNKRDIYASRILLKTVKEFSEVRMPPWYQQHAYFNIAGCLENQFGQYRLRYLTPSPKQYRVLYINFVSCDFAKLEVQTVDPLRYFIKSSSTNNFTFIIFMLSILHLLPDLRGKHSVNISPLSLKFVLKESLRLAEDLC